MRIAPTLIAVLALAGCAVGTDYRARDPALSFTPKNSCPGFEYAAACPTSSQEETELQAQELRNEQAKEAEEQKAAAERVLAKEKAMDEDNARIAAIHAEWFQQAKSACAAFPAGALLTAYNKRINSFQGRDIRWIEVRGIVPNARQASLWTLDEKLVGFQCSAYGIALTTDGSDMQVTAPIIFQISDDGRKLLRLGVGLDAPGL